MVRKTEADQGRADMRQLLAVPELLLIPAGYPKLLQDLKIHIRAARLQAALAVNRELVLLYWLIGREISSGFTSESWGLKIIDRLAQDLQAEFPGVQGFGRRNLRYMRAFAEAWPEFESLQQLVAAVPWGHNLRVIDGIKDRSAREWYLRSALEYGWSQNVLVQMIGAKLHERVGKEVATGACNLPAQSPEMAEQIVHDFHNASFLASAAPSRRLELERGLLIHLRDLLLGLGRGLAFLESRVALFAANGTFYIDLLFYHVSLHCYFLVEAKAGEFKAEYADKLHLGLFVSDHQMSRGFDFPTQGVLLCEGASGAVVEYALRDIRKPVRVSTHRHTSELPQLFQDALPSVEELQEVMEKLRGDFEAARNEEETSSAESP